MRRPPEQERAGRSGRFVAVWMLLLGMLIGIEAASGQTETEARSDVRDRRSEPLISRASLVDSRRVRLEYTFPSPAEHSLTATTRNAPDGLDPFTLAGIDLNGFSRELGVKAVRVHVEAVDVMELTMPGIAIRSDSDIPLSGDDAADARARAALPPMQITGVYPRDWAETRYLGVIGGTPISSLVIHPYRYDRARGLVLWARRLVLTVETEGTIDLAKATDISTAFERRDRSIESKSTRSLSSTAATTATVAPDGYEYKFLVQEDGVYRATARDLIALGVPIDRIDARTLKLYHDGIEVPLYIFDGNDNRLGVAPLSEEYIEFFGERRRAKQVDLHTDLYYDPYTRHNVYFLTWEGAPGKRIVEEAGDVRLRDIGEVTSLTERFASFQSSLHLERNEVKADLSNVELNTLSDRFDEVMWGKVEPTARTSFEIELPTPAIASNDPVHLTAALRGASGRYQERNEILSRGYQADIYLGDPKVAIGRFRGDAITYVSSDTNSAGVPLRSPLSSFTEGKGSVLVTNQVSAAGGSGGSFFVNWFNITYPRLYAAYNDTLSFTTPPGAGPGYYLFRLRGFEDPNIRIYRTGISRITNIAIVRSSSSGEEDTTSIEGGRSKYDAQFQAYAVSDRERFYAASESEIKRPLMLRDSAQNLRSSDNDYNYVVVVDDFSSNVERLDDPDHPLNRFVRFKQGSGEFKVKIVRATDIYDEFNGGAVSPLALRSFFQYAYHNWRTPLKFVMILSNGTPVSPELLTKAKIPDSLFDYMTEHAFVPTIRFQTVDWGPTPCDYLLGCFDGLGTIQQNLYELPEQRMVVDFFPEVLVGRVNVTELAHVRGYLDKLISQETKADEGEWKNRVGFIAGFESAFTNQINRFVFNQFRHNSEPHRIFTSPGYKGTPYANADRIFPLMNDLGVGVVAYLGHGGGSQWEDVAKLNSQEVAKLENKDRMPVVMSFTCFTGAYQADKGLLSAFLIQPEVGALLGFGTAAFGWLENNGWLAESIFAIMNNPKYRTLTFGEIVALGKAKYMGNRQRNDQGQVPTLVAMYSIFGDPSLRLSIARDTVNLHSNTSTATPGGRIAATARFPFTPTRVSASVFDTTEMPIKRFDLPAGATVSMDELVPQGYAQDFIGLRVYASDDQGHSATGAIRFATGSRPLVSVRAVDTVTVSRSAVFDVQLTNNVTIGDVIVLLRYANGQVTLDSQRVRVTRQPDGSYRTDPIDGSIILPGAIIHIIVPVTGTLDGNATFTFYAEGGADPSAYPPTPLDSTREVNAPHPELAVDAVPNQTIGLVATPNGARLSATVFNWGDRPISGLPFELWVQEGAGRRILGQDVVDVPARSGTTVQVDIGAQLPVQTKVYMTLLPTQGERWQDSYDKNNQSSHIIPLLGGAFTPALGFTTNGSSTAPFIMPHLGQLEMAPGAARGVGLVTAVAEPTLPKTEQPWYFLPIGDTTFMTRSVRLRLAPGASDTALAALTLIVENDTGSLGGERKIVRYNTTTGLWVAYPTTLLSDPIRAVATVPVDGLYAIAESEDREGPIVRFSVEGQFYSDSSVVPPDARFSAVVYDPSGVDTDLEKLRLTIDGELLRPNVDFSMLDSTITPTAMNLRIQREVDPGRHTLCLMATDRLGNSREVCTSFEVERDLSLRVYGNFPNPFDKVTFLAYEIRGASMVDEVELKIFSPAGKLVRTFRSPSATPNEYLGLEEGGTGRPTALGYHEAWWDGKDNDGVEVANGVYFYRLRITLNDEVLEKLGVMARIR